MQPACSSPAVQLSTGRHSYRDKRTTSTFFLLLEWRSLATQAKRVTDEMFIEAARAVADQVPDEPIEPVAGSSYPLQSDILETEIQTAARVAKLVSSTAVWRGSSGHPTWSRLFGSMSTSPNTTKKQRPEREQPKHKRDRFRCWMEASPLP